MLASILSGEFLLHTLSWLHLYAGSFSYTSRARSFFLFFFFLSGEFLLYVPCLLDFSLGCFSDTSHAVFNFIWRVSLTHPVLVSVFSLGVSLTYPVLTLVLSGEFLLHIPCWLQFYLGSLSYTSRAGLNFIWGVSFIHTVLASILSWEFLLHIPLASFVCGEFVLHVLSWLNLYAGILSYTSRAGFFFILGVSLTHPMLA